jgi:hypothetical protein
VHSARLCDPLEELSERAVQIEQREGPPPCLEVTAERPRQVKATLPPAERAPGTSEGLETSQDPSEPRQLAVEERAEPCAEGMARYTWEEANLFREELLARQESSAKAEKYDVDSRGRENESGYDYVGCVTDWGRVAESESDYGYDGSATGLEWVEGSNDLRVVAVAFSVEEGNSPYHATGNGGRSSPGQDGESDSSEKGNGRRRVQELGTFSWEGGTSCAEQRHMQRRNRPPTRNGLRRVPKTPLSPQRSFHESVKHRPTFGLPPRCALSSFVLSGPQCPP